MASFVEIKVSSQPDGTYAEEQHGSPGTSKLTARAQAYTGRLNRQDSIRVQCSHFTELYKVCQITQQGSTINEFADGSTEKALEVPYAANEVRVDFRSNFDQVVFGCISGGGMVSDMTLHINETGQQKVSSTILDSVYPTNDYGATSAFTGYLAVKVGDNPVQQARTFVLIIQGSSQASRIQCTVTQQAAPAPQPLETNIDYLKVTSNVKTQ